MRPLSGKRYCVHVFDYKNSPVFYLLTDELMIGGMRLKLESDRDGVTIWGSALEPNVVPGAKGRFTCAVDSGRVDATYVGNGGGPGRKTGHHAWRLVLTDADGTALASRRTSPKRAEALAAAAEMIQAQWPTAQMYRDRFAYARAHERRVDSVHTDPDWFCRPIRGRQRVNHDDEEWESRPEVNYTRVVLACDSCGADFYPNLDEQTYEGIISGRIRAKVPPCRRCGGRLTLDTYSLTTSSGDLPMLSGQ